MDIVEAVQARRSVRDFKPDPVPRGVLEEILRIAMRAPSRQNVQPWHITVLSGKVLENVKRESVRLLASGVAPHPELTARAYEGQYRQRQVDLAVAIFQLLGIAREDKEKRQRWYEKGFRFFDAPAAIVLTTDRSVDDSNALAFDIGALTQTICLLAVKYGLGTCLQGGGFPEAIRKFAPIPQSHKIMISIAIGYPNWDFPANKLVTPREPLEKCTTWCGT